MCRGGVLIAWTTLQNRACPAPAEDYALLTAAAFACDIQQIPRLTAARKAWRAALTAPYAVLPA